MQGQLPANSLSTQHIYFPLRKNKELADHLCGVLFAACK